MTLEGWIFMVGLRVFDIGALIVWLVWFFRLRDDDDDSDDGRGGEGREPEPKEPKGPSGGLKLPLPDAGPWPSRRRDHGGDLRPAPATSRRGVPEPVPARAPVKRRQLGSTFCSFLPTLPEEAKWPASPRIRASTRRPQARPRRRPRRWRTSRR